MELLQLAIEAHPLAIPTKIVGYRIVTIKHVRREQVLVEWAGLPDSEQTWEELGWVSHLNPRINLEDKVRVAGVGDVTIIINEGLEGTDRRK